LTPSLLRKISLLSSVQRTNTDLLSLEEFAPYAKRLSVGLLGEDKTSLLLFMKTFDEMGLTSIKEFSKARDLIEFSIVQPFNVIFALKEISDMHWTTFIRTIRANAMVPNIPLVLVLPGGGNADVVIKKEKEDLNILKSYDFKLIRGIPVNADGLSKYIQKIVSSDESNVSVQKQLEEAKELFSQGLKKRAKKIYKEILKENKNLKAKVGAAQCSDDDLKEQMGQLKELLDQDPENFNFKFELITNLVKQNHTFRARTLFNQIMNELKNSNEPYWLTALGEVCAKNKLDIFVDKVIKTLSVKGDSGVTWQVPYIRARQAIAKNDMLEAQKHLDEAVEKSSGDQAELFNLHGVILKRNNEYDRAINSYRKAFDLLPEDHRIAFNIGLVYLAQKDQESAKKYFEISISISPNYEKAKKKLAVMEKAG